MHKIRRAKEILSWPGRYHEVDDSLKVREVNHQECAL